MAILIRTLLASMFIGSAAAAAPPLLGGINTHQRNLTNMSQFELVDISADGDVIVGNAREELGIDGRGNPVFVNRRWQWTRKYGSRRIQGGVSLFRQKRYDWVDFPDSWSPHVLEGWNIPFVGVESVSAVSPDGSIMLGANSYTEEEAFYDHEGGGLHTVSHQDAVFWDHAGMHAVTEDARPLDVANGSVLVQIGHAGTAEIWSGGSAERITDRPLPSLRADLSADGSVVAGTQRDEDGASRAFRWTRDGGISLFDPGTTSRALSPDGETMLLQQFIAPGVPGAWFVWTPDDGLQTIDPLPTTSLSEFFLSDAGVVAGTSPEGGYLWNQQDGITLLKDLVGRPDLSLEVSGMSGDGTVLMGGGGWILDLNPPVVVPEPSTWLLAVLAIALAGAAAGPGRGIRRRWIRSARY